MRILKVISIIIIAFIINLFSNLQSFGKPADDFLFTVTVSDSASKKPVQSARVSILKGNVPVETELTNVTGRAIFKYIKTGKYVIQIFSEGYNSFVDSLDIDGTNLEYSASLSELNYQTQEIDVVGEREQSISTAVDTKTGDQVFNAQEYHAPPEEGMTNVIQENLTGAVKAPTGEVHINGEHGEYSYYVDGIPIPLGVFGGLNEVVDSKVIDKATFISDGYPAEYGGQMTAVIDIINRVPTGKFHLDFSTYAGSYLVFNGAKPFSPVSRFLQDYRAMYQVIL